MVIDNNNVIFGMFNDIENSTVKFLGKGNILFIESGVRLLNSNLTFKGNNSLVYLSSNNNSYVIKISINSDCTVFIGKDNYFNEGTLIVSSESRNVFIGDNCLFSLGTVIRNADAHLIYDMTSGERVNFTKSIYVGDHVWIGQNALLLKGVIVGSGSIIGAASVISNKVVNSNSIFAGVPAREIRKNIFWSGECVHSWTKEMTNKFSSRDRFFYYERDEDTLSIEQFEDGLNSLINASERLDYVLDKFKGKKNRMFT